MLRYHMGAPPLSDTYENSLGTANIANVLTDGTLDEHVVQVQARLHRAPSCRRSKTRTSRCCGRRSTKYQPNGWFWWSKGTGAQFVQLWRTMYNYLTNTKGLNNLVWLMPSSGSPNASWYPARSRTWTSRGPTRTRRASRSRRCSRTTRNIVGTHDADPAPRDRDDPESEQHVSDAPRRGCSSTCGPATRSATIRSRACRVRIRTRTRSRATRFRTSGEGRVAKPFRRVGNRLRRRDGGVPLLRNSLGQRIGASADTPRRFGDDEGRYRAKPGAAFCQATSGGSGPRAANTGRARSGGVRRRGGSDDEASRARSVGAGSDASPGP